MTEIQTAMLALDRAFHPWLKTGDSAENSVKNVGRMTMTLDDWISRFDNEGADKLTQTEQLEIKSMLIELRWRRDEMNDFTETMKDRAEAWLGAYNNQEG